MTPPPVPSSTPPPASGQNVHSVGKAGGGAKTIVPSVQGIGGGVNQKTVALLVGSLLLWSCAGRLPTQTKTHAIIHKHFHQYGKKYPDSVFGGKKVLDVEILKIEEIHKHLIAVQTFITIEGPEVFKVRMLIEKGPLGWRYLAWENLSGG